MRESTRTRRLALIFAAASAISSLGCSAGANRGFEGAWAYSANGSQGVERYLLVERARTGYLVFLVDLARGELDGGGRASMKGGKLVAEMGGNAFLDLELSGKAELRAAMRKPSQSEDLTFLFYRADSAAGEGRFP